MDMESSLTDALRHDVEGAWHRFPYLTNRSGRGPVGNFAVAYRPAHFHLGFGLDIRRGITARFAFPRVFDTPLRVSIGGRLFNNLRLNHR